MSTNNLNFSFLASNGTETTILGAVRDYAPVSRTRIAELTGLPRAAVSRSAIRLLQNKIITDAGMSDTQGPRKKRGLILNPHAGYVIAVEYGPRGLEGAVVDTAYQTMILDSRKLSLEKIPRDEKIDIIIEFFKHLQKQVPPGGKCLGVAAIDPGLVDSKAGRTVLSTTMENWENVPMVEILQDRLGLPGLLPNAMMSKVRAVNRLEIPGNTQNIVYVEYGDGIACGMKLAGKYIPGESNIAGELGHVRVTDDEIPCRCGAVGCLEAVAALSALAKNAKEAIDKNSNSSLVSLDEINGGDVLAAAASGDRLASRIVEKAFEYLGRAIAGAVNILDPQIVFLDNRITKAGNDAVNSLMRSLTKNVSTLHSNKLQLRISNIESHLGALGGATAVLDHCLNCNPNR